MRYEIIACYYLLEKKKIYIYICVCVCVCVCVSFYYDKKIFKYYILLDGYTAVHLH